MSNEEPARGLMGALAATVAPLIAHRLASDAGEARAGEALLGVTRLRLQALDAAIALDAPELSAAQHQWDEQRLSATGTPVPAEELDAAIIDELEHHLGEGMLDRVQQMQERAREVDLYPDLAEPSPTELDHPARAFLDAALEGRRDMAVEVVDQAVADGLAPAEVMTTLLQPAMVEIGRRWQQGEVTIAHEHLATTAVQLCLSQLHPEATDSGPTQQHVVATTVGSETHDLGIRMICDLMAGEGWRASYLGADVPTHDVVTYVAHTAPAVLAVSVTMAGHLMLARDLIREVRAHPRCADVRILVGGGAFSVNPRLAMRIDADGWAPGAREAVELCRMWAAPDRAQSR